MTQTALSRREYLLFTISAYVILVAVAAMGFASAPSTMVRWAPAAMALVFGLLMARMPSSESPLWLIYLYLVVQAGLVAALMTVHPDWSVFTLLYFVLSAQAMLLLPLRRGAVWVAVLALITAGFSLYYWGWPGGMVASLLYAAGYGSFGVFANALVRADTARRESQSLLAELQEAHRQLQEYALRVEALAVVEERNRLAREMHDTLGHRLTVASVQLEGAQRLCSLDPERAASMVGTVREQVREALQELRHTVAALRTPVAADLELPSSLKRLATDFEQATGLTIHQVLPDEMPDLPDTHRLALYRAAQEALTNVQSHANSSQVSLALTNHDNAAVLLVGDDGKGTSLSRDQAGFGLQGLRERATRLGGEMHLEPRQGGGTQFSFRLPLPAHVFTEAAENLDGTAGQVERDAGA